MSPDELERWRAAQDAKRAEQARRRALDAAALESQRNPVRPPPRPARPPRADTRRPRGRGALGDKRAAWWPHGFPGFDALRVEYIAGAELTQMAARHGVSVETIRRALKRAGTVMRYHRKGTSDA